MDEQSAARYRNMAESGVTEDIAAHIRYDNGEYFFRNEADGRCAMLESDGLCKIWRLYGEQSLCRTCRKYPLLVWEREEGLFVSMEASCPVVTEYLWKEEIDWYYCNNNKIISRFDIMEILGNDERAWYREISAVLCERMVGREISSLAKNVDAALVRKEIKTKYNRYKLFWRVVEGCLDLLLQFPEQPYLRGSFEYFEEEHSVLQIVQDISAFESTWQSSFCHFMKNYISYRLFALSCQEREMSAAQKSRQILGELCLVYVVSYSRFHVLGSEEERMPESVWWMYRFTAHGRLRAKKVQDFFSLLFSDDREAELLLGLEAEPS